MRVDTCKTCKKIFEHKCHAHRKYCSLKCQRNGDWLKEMKKSHLGKPAWNKGKSAPWVNWKILFKPEVREKALERAIKSNTGRISKWKGKKLEWLRGEKNGVWKGDKVGYNALHHWVNREIGQPFECIYCGKNRLEERIEWASVSHHAKRDLSDYISLCVPCHRDYDKKVRV